MIGIEVTFDRMLEVTLTHINRLPMKTGWKFMVGLLLLPVLLLAQENNGPITLVNPSFEGIPALGDEPNGWMDCGFPGESKVDVHPVPNSQFRVEKLSQHGDTYMGMVVRDNETYERVSQRLIRPMEGGKCYEFSMYLARSVIYESVGRAGATKGKPMNYNQPAVLRIWGGNGYCRSSELLAETSPIEQSRWLEYNFRFEPKASHTYIMFEAFYKTPVLVPYSGNILLDNCSAILPVPCDEEEIAMEPEVEQPTPPAQRPVETEPTPQSRPQTPAPPEIVATEPVERKSKLLNKTREDLQKGSILQIENLFFDADSAVIKPISYETLVGIYDFLEENQDVVVEIGGHTNSTPPHSYCDDLSRRRAEAVVAFLSERGITENRLVATGYGKRKPKFPNNTPANRRKNQRVEIKILSIDS